MVLRNLNILLLLLLLLLVSCGSGHHALPGNPEPMPEEENIYLRFTIMTRNQGQSRAADIDGDYTGSGAENYIDVTDIQYLLFDADGNYLYNVTPMTRTLAADDNYTVYDVTARLYHYYFTRNIDNPQIGFYILVLANLDGWGITLPDTEPGTSLQQYFTLTSCLPTEGTLPDAAALMNVARESAGNTQRFPMAGLQYFSVSTDKLKASTATDPYNISDVADGGKDINLLRSLSKIEVIDKIGIPDDAVFNPATDDTGVNRVLRIGSVAVNGIMDRGTLLPSFTEWVNANASETQQVDNPTQPASARYIAPAPFADGKEPGAEIAASSLSFVHDPIATEARDDKCPVYSAYLFEYSKTGIGQSLQPYMRVTTKGGTETRPDNTTVTHAPVTYYLRMAQYTGGHATSADNLPALLRNHIYRFEVTALSQSMTVHWTVCDMDTGVSDITFN